MADYISLLNPEQYEAATAPDGPLLILAAAGTGKTRTLVCRVVHLLEKGVPPERILLLTFTNRAAREMLDRAGAATRGLAGGLWGGTFHSVANRMLRRHAASLGFPPDFTILDADDQRSLMGRVIKDLGYKPKEFAKREVVLSLLSGAVNRGVAVEDWVEKRALSLDVPPEQIIEAVDRYRKAKVELQAMDFDDLLVNGLLLLRENEAARRDYQARFLHVLVDEYQDTNALQAEFVDVIGAVHGNVSVVGDDFQCIYSWRGSEYRNIMEFPERHPGTRIVKLERNYRSKAPILDLANASIAHNVDQFPKVLRATREGAAALPKVVEVLDGKDQAAYVVEAIRENLDAGYRPEDIAVLYRAHFNAVDLQLALARSGIEYAITSGTGFYELAHVKDVVALLRVAEAMQDPISLTRLLMLLPGVGAATADKIVKKLGGGLDPANEAAGAAVAAGLPARAKGAWSSLFGEMAHYPSRAFPERVKCLVERFLDAFYRDRLRKDFDNADDRENDIRELLADIAGHDGVRSFLSDVALLTNLDRRAANSGQAGGRVLLSTVHQAKGLEWPVVIVLWLAEGVFPSARALEDQGGDEEERRLFYVAVTRARDRLWLMQPSLRTSPDGGRFYAEKSRFLRELPPALYEKESSGASGGDAWGGSRAGAWRGSWGGLSRDFGQRRDSLRVGGVKLELPF
ncbi:MAG: ATP-dependent helicase [Kiritimatiellae bacterium]|nr:ATP-dependent helicase [Kiritimatiellia bacterium]